MGILFILPLIGVSFAVLAFATAYIVAVARQDVYPWWPYISDTGTTVPESCIFGELLTLTAVFALFGMIVRYKWIQAFNVEDKKLRMLNIIGLIIGIISCFGMTMVANFQETSVRSVHLPSSAVTFGFGLIYNFVHTEITRRMSPRYSSVCVWVLRLILCLMGLVGFCFLYGFGLDANIKGKIWYGNDTYKKLEWDPKDPGWGLHLVSAISEWTIGLSVILYFLTYTFEFSRIKLRIESEVIQPSERIQADETTPLMT